MQRRDERPPLVLRVVRTLREQLLELIHHQDEPIARGSLPGGERESRRVRRQLTPDRRGGHPGKRCNPKGQLIQG